jgi:hypothetical protein
MHGRWPYAGIGCPRNKAQRRLVSSPASSSSTTLTAFDHCNSRINTSLPQISLSLTPIHPTWQLKTVLLLSTRRPSPQSVATSAATAWRSIFSTGPKRRTSRTATSCWIPRLLRMSRALSCPQLPPDVPSLHTLPMLPATREHTQTNRLTNRALQAKALELERQRATDNLRKGLNQRPARDDLIQRNILPDSTAAPALQGHQRDLDLHMRADNLEKSLKDRPSPEELVKQGILQEGESPAKDV